MSIAKRLRETPQRVERLRDLDEQGVVGRWDRALDHRGAGASGECVSDELMPVALVAESEEDLTRLHDARIERAADESFVRAWGPLNDAATRRREQLIEREHQRMVPTDQGRSGCTRAFRSTSIARSWNALIAVSVPSSFVCGRSSTMTATKRGSFAGANPANDEIYASST